MTRIERHTVPHGPDHPPHEHVEHLGHGEHTDHGEHTGRRGDAGHHHHPTGLRGRLRHLLVPHSHDAADSIDDALEASAAGVRAVRTSLLVLGATAAAQLVVVLVSGSVALLADTVHNVSDALTAVPLWIAFVLGRRAPTRRYTFGLGRAEDLAGLVIVAMIALSAVVAAAESVRRLSDPQPVAHLGWVLVAGLIGFVGNEAVALYRIRVGRQIGSAALVADGVHARTDGLTSLAVVVGALGVWAGVPAADPIVGLAIAAVILVLLWGTARDVGRRLLDGVEPDLVDRATRAIDDADGVRGVHDVRVRWSGHRLEIQARVMTDPTLTVVEAQRVTDAAAERVRDHVPRAGTVLLVAVPHRR